MNSSRSINHATHVSLRTDPDSMETGISALGFAGVLVDIAPSPTELDMLRDMGGTEPELAQAADLLTDFTNPDRAFVDRLEMLAASDIGMLEYGLRRVIETRRTRIGEAVATASELAAHADAVATADVPTETPTIDTPSLYTPSIDTDTDATLTFDSPRLVPPGTPTFLSTSPSMLSPAPDPSAPTPADTRFATSLNIVPVPGLALLSEAAGLAETAELGEPTLETLLAHDGTSGISTAPLRGLLDDLRIDPAGTGTTALERTIITTINRQDIRLTQFLQGLKTQPIGYLHLERVQFSPMGTERGELVYTAPLAPEETLNFTHTEWSLVTEELETFVRDELDDFSERGVTEKTDLAQSFENESKVEQQFKASAKVGGSFGKAFTFSTEASYDLKDATRNSVKQAIKSTKDVTHKASTRAKQEHKQTFKVTQQSRIEDVVTRQVKNPHKDKVMRVDYYRMMRRWKVDLLRYGLRLTWDINVPEPGLDLLSKIQMIRIYDRLLAIPFERFFTFGFEDTDKAFSGRGMDHPEGFGPVREAATRYGATVTPPPPLVKSFRASALRNFPGEQSKTDEFLEFKWEFKDYYITGASSLKDLIDLDLTGPNEKFAEVVDVNYVPYGNQFQVIVRKRNVTSLAMRMKLVTLQLEDNVRMTWRLETYQALRDAAEERYDRLKTMLMEEREKLVAQLRETDTLSLRRIEREEMIKNVLRWLLGPSFQFVLPGMATNAPLGQLGATTSKFYDAVTKSVLSGNIHEIVLKHGELIKFLHQAVEWENIQYILYPYFWVNPNEWQEKMDLKHHDPIHEAFLKSGSARVVLPIRPGFEARFAMFIQRGQLEVPDSGPVPPYVRIAQEMQNASRTNYPGIRAANPETSPRPLLTYRQRQAWDAMEEIIKLIEAYRKDRGSYPAALSDLDGLSPAPVPAVADRKDPWGRAFHYQFPGTYSEFDLASWGANGKPGVETPADPASQPNPEDQDITNWTDAALVGTWFEYTPTSALDVDVVTRKIAES